MESFKKIIDGMNELYQGISTTPRFWYEEVDNRLYIYAGLQGDLMQLWLMLHQTTYNHCLYYEGDIEERFIEVINLKN